MFIFIYTILALISLPSWFADAPESSLAMFAVQTPIFIAWHMITLVCDGTDTAPEVRVSINRLPCSTESASAERAQTTQIFWIKITRLGIVFKDLPGFLFIVEFFDAFSLKIAPFSFFKQGICMVLPLLARTLSPRLAAPVRGIPATAKSLCSGPP